MLIGDGASEEVIPTSSEILSKLDLERFILVHVFRTRFVHITLKIHHNCDVSFPYFFAQMCTQMRFCVYVATPLSFVLNPSTFILCISGEKMPWRESACASSDAVNNKINTCIIELFGFCKGGTS